MMSVVLPKQHRSRTFFVRGLQTLLPTLVTLYLIVWAWDFLWEQLGRRLIWVIQNVQYQLAGESAQWIRIRQFWMYVDQDNQWVWEWWAQLVGVSLAVLLVYGVGLLVGNLIGRTFWSIGESLVMRLPVVRAIYPAVKQVTDFVLADKSHDMTGRRVVACRPHAGGIWSIGLVTGAGPASLVRLTEQELLTIFIPSSPTAFSGYVVIVPRADVVELPMTVEEAMKLIISGGVLDAPAAVMSDVQQNASLGQASQP
jgi:uncharacterized membrane protein